MVVGYLNKIILQFIQRQKWITLGKKKIYKRKLMSVVPLNIEMLLLMKIINIPSTQDWTDRIKG